MLSTSSMSYTMDAPPSPVAPTILKALSQNALRHASSCALTARVALPAGFAGALAGGGVCARACGCRGWAGLLGASSAISSSGGGWEPASTATQEKFMRYALDVAQVWAALMAARRWAKPV